MTNTSAATLIWQKWCLSFSTCSGWPWAVFHRAGKASFSQMCCCRQVLKTARSLFRRWGRTCKAACVDARSTTYVTFTTFRNSLGSNSRVSNVMSHPNTVFSSLELTLRGRNLTYDQLKNLKLAGGGNHKHRCTELWTVGHLFDQVNHKPEGGKKKCDWPDRSNKSWLLILRLHV